MNDEKRLEGFNDDEIHIIQQALYKYANNRYIVQAPETRLLTRDLMKEFYEEKQRRSEIVL